MTRYFQSKAEAQDYADAVADDPRIATVKVELEPYNGWVAVLFPALQVLDDLEKQGYEIDRHGKRTKDPNKKKSRFKTEPAVAGAPRKAGATARVWQIADAVSAAGGDRKAIVEACVAEGINASTAATQYSRWKRAKQ